MWFEIPVVRVEVTSEMLNVTWMNFKITEVDVKAIYGISKALTSRPFKI